MDRLVAVGRWYGCRGHWPQRAGRSDWPADCHSFCRARFPTLGQTIRRRPDGPFLQAWEASKINLMTTATAKSIPTCDTMQPENARRCLHAVAFFHCRAQNGAFRVE